MVDSDEYTGVVDNKNLFIVYTMRGETVRMISVRSATKREKERKEWGMTDRQKPTLTEEAHRTWQN